MKFLILFLIAGSALGQSSNPNDTLKIGDKNSSSDKGIIFDTNDGVSNKSLKVNPTSKRLIFTGNEFQVGDGASTNDKELVLDPASGTSIKWEGSDNYVELRTPKLRIGKGVSEDVVQEIDLGLGASNPKIKWDNTKGKLVFSNDGVKENVFGSGSGSGGGSNFNNGFTADDNGNAEDGITGWAASAGTFAVSSVLPLEGDQSFTWTPAAQGDTLTSPVLDFEKSILAGRSCQSQITYTGGDENLTLQVIDADGDVLSSEVLKPHSIASEESSYFICPKIDASANDLDLRLRLINEGATASAQIKFDKSYVGTLIGLSETTLPDYGSVEIQTIDGAILSDDLGILSSCSATTTGKGICSFKSGVYSVPPLLVAAKQTGIPDADGNDDVRSVEIKEITATGFTYRLKFVDPTTSSDFNGLFTATFKKQGADAKQTVQVYKSIPKVSENVNEFSAYIDNNGSVLSENVNWINGNCTYNGVGNYTCDYIPGLFSEIPSCTASVSRSGSTHIVVTNNPTANEFSVRVTAANNTPIDRGVGIKCSKQGSDYKLPTVQPVIVGQFANSYAEQGNNVRIESCRVDNNGVPAIGTPDCNNWIDSITDFGVGESIIIPVSGIFKEWVTCALSGFGNSDSNISASAAFNINSIPVRTRVSGSVSDQPYWIICTGGN